MAYLLDAVPDKVLAIYAHPDDPDVSCGGTLARWAQRGSEVHVVLCTNGDKGTTDPTVDPAELAERRAEECDEAAKVLGLTDQHVLGYRDGELTDDDGFRGELVRWIRRLRPTMVLCPDPTAVFFGEDYFNHRDHRIVGFAVLDALSPAAALPLYFPDAGPVHQVDTVLLSGTLEPTVWVDISATIEDKAAAVSCHRSQFTGDGEWAADAVRLRAAEDGKRAGVAFAEGFRRLRPSV
ncbi:MAG TPA: PIG-L deacetylase family protein [Acidimicrobiales bacterium]|nr:PIG-L deacetylase family protein [Acidimicrobiales bacterium]